MPTTEYQNGMFSSKTHTLRYTASKCLRCYKLNKTKVEKCEFRDVVKSFDDVYQKEEVYLYVNIDLKISADADHAGHAIGVTDVRAGVRE